VDVVGTIKICLLNYSNFRLQYFEESNIYYLHYITKHKVKICNSIQNIIVRGLTINYPTYPKQVIKNQLQNIFKALF